VCASCLCTSPLPAHTSSFFTHLDRVALTNSRSQCHWHPLHTMCTHTHMYPHMNTDTHNTRGATHAARRTRYTPTHTRQVCEFLEHNTHNTHPNNTPALVQPPFSCRGVSAKVEQAAGVVCMRERAQRDCVRVWCGWRGVWCHWCVIMCVGPQKT